MCVFVWLLNVASSFLVATANLNSAKNTMTRVPCAYQQVSSVDHCVATTPRAYIYDLLRVEVEFALGAVVASHERQETMLA